MGNYLVVANQTLGGEQLPGEVRRRMAAEPSSFYVVVPNTRPADIMRLPGEPLPSAFDTSEAVAGHGSPAPRGAQVQPAGDHRHRQQPSRVWLSP